MSLTPRLVVRFQARGAISYPNTMNSFLDKFKRYNDSDSEVNEAFLKSGSDDGQPVSRRNASPGRRAGSFCLLQLVLIAIYTTVFFICIPSLNHSIVYSPAQSAVKKEKLRYNATLIIESEYNGPPSDEVDAAWTKLMDNMNIGLPKSDLDRIGSKSIPIPGTDLYFAGLSVFHELHCIKRLRQYTWKDHYFPNVSADEERLNRLHTDHCLEILRQASMCRADISLFTLEWSRDSLQPRADFSQEHECVNFEALNKWAGEHRIEAGTPGLLKHPLHGIAFPDGKGSKIGGSEDTSPTIE